MQEREARLLGEKFVILQGQGQEREISPAERLLKERIEGLEERMEQMRLSRRVLMRLLERSEQDNRVELENLRRENKLLHEQNRRLARLAWQNRLK